MRAIQPEQISSALADLIDRCLKNVDDGVIAAVSKAEKTETGAAKWAARQIIENAEVASKTNSYACQDTGQAVIFCSVGEDVHISGLTAAINEGVRLGYKEARKSVADPITRKNTSDNTPAVIHYDMISGDKIKISFLAKGAGSENMSRLYMLVPADGEDGIVNAAVDCVKRGGFNACPPLCIGLGIGGTAEKACALAKAALLRKTGEKSKREDVAKIEERVLSAVNALKIGIGGYGGNTTAISVAAEVAPTHIGMLPVCVCLNCHSVRHGEVEI